MMIINYKNNNNFITYKIFLFKTNLKKIEKSKKNKVKLTNENFPFYFTCLVLVSFNFLNGIRVKFILNSSYLKHALLSSLLKGYT